MPPGQQHRGVPPPILFLLQLLAIILCNVRQGLGNNVAENAGPQTALKLIDTENLLSETSAKVRDGGNEIRAIQSKDTRPKLLERSDTGSNSTKISGVYNLVTLIGSFSKIFTTLLKSKARGGDHRDRQEDQPPNSPNGENDGQKASSNGGINNDKVPQEIRATDTNVSKGAETWNDETGASGIEPGVPKPVEGAEAKNTDKAENNTLPEVSPPESKKTFSGESSASSDTENEAKQGKDLSKGHDHDGRDQHEGLTGSKTAQETPHENHESGQRGGAEAGHTTGPTENMSGNPTLGTNSGEPGVNNQVHGTSEKNSDGKNGSDLAPREPGPTVITGQKRTNIREITIVNFVIWNLGKAAGVKAIGLRRKEISSKLTISANRIQGTRFSQQDRNRAQPDRGSYQIYRGVIMNGRVLSFGELRSKAYGGFRAVGILDARLAVALFCQRRYAQRMHLALQVQCRMWRRQYRRLFYQYEKLRGAPRYNRGSYEARGRFYANKGARPTEDEDAPSAGEAEVGGPKGRRRVNNLAERSEMDPEISAPRLARGAVLS